MQITSIRIKKIKNDNNLLGVASIELDNCLIIHDIKLVQLKDKRIISFPNKKVNRFDAINDGYNRKYEYTDIIHPSNQEFRNYIQDELFKIYDSETRDNNE